MVYTYSVSKPYAQDYTPHYCDCGRVATYWSQDEWSNWKPLGPVVYHCLGCRNIARQKAGTKNQENKNVIQISG